MISKTAMITICGRPNVGKSTLTNALAGEKIAIVSNKPQTTRNRITAVCQRGETQFVFLDTPGFHKPRTRLGDYMVNVVRQSVADVDAVVLVVEPVASLGPQERELIASIKAANCPAVLAINKLDTVEPEKLLAVIALYSEAYAFNAIVPISAKTGDGVEELLKELDKFAVESPALFPEGVTTDQPEKQVCAELIREKLLLNLEREVPHGTAVEITRFPSGTTASSIWKRRSTAKRRATRGSSSASTARCSKRSARTPARILKNLWVRRCFCRRG